VPHALKKNQKEENKRHKIETKPNWRINSEHSTVSESSIIILINNIDDYGGHFRHNVTCKPFLGNELANTFPQIYDS
jgi:hypothetical protein